MENETLKQLVLAKCEEVAPIFATKYELAPFVNVQCHFDGNGFGIFRNWTDSDAEFEVCRLRVELPAHSGEWWIAAKILEIETEMSIDEFELSMAIRQHYNDMQDAHHAGFTNGNENGIHMTKEQSWEAFIGDYGKEEMKQPVPLFDSQLHELCVALGWQGGTYHHVLSEVKRLKAAAAKPDAITFVGYVGSKTWKGTGSEYLGINCGEFGMIELTSAVKEKGKPIHQMYCEHVKITVEQLTIDEAKTEFTAIGGTWHEQL